jgi:hypothetical protein
MNGPDGLLVLLRNRFGVGLAPEKIKEIKLEVHNEIRAMKPNVPPGVAIVQATQPSEPTGTLAASVPIPAIPNVIATAEITPHVTSDPSDDIRSAVELVLGALPNLRTFVISVDEHGEASVDYTMREVRVVETGGSLKVRK